MTSIYRALLCFLLPPLLLTCVQAVTYIDDVNAVVGYLTTQSGRPSGSWVHDATCNEAQTTKSNVTCFNNTLSYIVNDDKLDQTASFGFKFRGSGVTLYIFKSGASNVSISIDNQPPVYRSYDVIYGTREFNYSFFDAQGLVFDQHNISLRLHNVATTSPFDNTTAIQAADFYFDYAVVNDEGGPSGGGSGGSSDKGSSASSLKAELLLQMSLLGAALTVLVSSLL